ncbi:MAG: 3-isopropylmalate dehydrogenase [Candidatus Omnitrophica bacterium]|nr:3-isopropylmalate dehydrogenase [Candidatus Omnitrophota bacterium]
MALKSYTIAVIAGDGTGPEVVAEGLKVLAAVSELNGFKYVLTHLNYGGKRYLETGNVLTGDELAGLNKFDAIYLGAVGDPNVAPGIIERGLLLKIRFGLDQYVNLRPVKLYPGVDTPLKNKKPEDIDFVVVRENTEGFYVGEGEFIKKDTPEETAIQISRNTRKGVERCIRFAFEYARNKRQRKQLTLCAKTNVLNYASNLWERTFNEVAKKYPDVKTNYAHVDAACMWMVKNPEWFDVIVTDNMFGDIITDLGAMIQGGMGIAAGGNINPEGVSMFEPIGGSAPKYTGQGVINPLAAVCAVQMLLAELGEDAAANQIEKAVMFVTANKLKSLAAGQMGYSTSQVGDLVVEALKIKN